MKSNFNANTIKTLKVWLYTPTDMVSVKSVIQRHYGKKINIGKFCYSFGEKLSQFEKNVEINVIFLKKIKRCFSTLGRQELNVYMICPNFFKG